jgi:menaquinone-dependent protoporphyrinogen oxidase
MALTQLGLRILTKQTLRRTFHSTNNNTLFKADLSKMSVLIAIASSHNSTMEIGTRIAERLRVQPGLGPVDVLPAADIPKETIAQYAAVVVGSGIHRGKWLSPARGLIHRDKAVLAPPKAVWAFSVGMPFDEKNYKDESEKVEQAVRTELPDIRGHMLFRGRMEKEDLPWVVGYIMSWFPKYCKFGDFREWDKVDAWAEAVGKEIQELPK